MRHVTRTLHVLATLLCIERAGSIWEARDVTGHQDGVDDHEQTHWPHGAAKLRGRVVDNPDKEWFHASSAEQSNDSSVDVDHSAESGVKSIINKFLKDMSVDYDILFMKYLGPT